MMLYRIRGAILIGIFIVAIISWPRPTAVTYFPHSELGDQRFDFFKKIDTFHPINKIGNAIDVSSFLRYPTGPNPSAQYAYGKGHVWYALVTFLYVDILGTSNYHEGGPQLMRIKKILPEHFTRWLNLPAFVILWRSTLKTPPSLTASMPSVSVWAH